MSGCTMIDRKGVTLVELLVDRLTHFSSFWTFFPPRERIACRGISRVSYCPVHTYGVRLYGAWPLRHAVGNSAVPTDGYRITS